MGQFSWFTQDDHSQIVDDKKEDVYMVDPRDGTIYKETCYDGYGHFGGRDYYELLADINKDIILRQNVKNYKKYDKEVLKIILFGSKLHNFMFQLEGKTLDEVKLFFMDLDYRGTHLCNKDGSFPTPKLEDFDKWYQNHMNEEIQEQIYEDEKYIKLYSKEFKDLTEDDINDKRQDGIDLWFHYVEPECSPGNCKHLECGEKITCPILVRNVDRWKWYTKGHPETDPNQGWECNEEEEVEE